MKKVSLLLVLVTANQAYSRLVYKLRSDWRRNVSIALC